MISKEVAKSDKRDLGIVLCYWSSGWLQKPQVLLIILYQSVKRWSGHVKNNILLHLMYIKVCRLNISIIIYVQDSVRSHCIWFIYCLCYYYIPVCNWWHYIPKWPQDILLRQNYYADDGRVWWDVYWSLMVIHEIQIASIIQTWYNTLVILNVLICRSIASSISFWF